MSRNNLIRAQRPIRLLAVALTVFGGFQALIGIIFYIASPSHSVNSVTKSSSNTSDVIVQALVFNTALTEFGVTVIDKAQKFVLPAAIGGGLLTVALGLGVARVSQQSSGTPRHPSNEGVDKLRRKDNRGFPRPNQTPDSKDVEGLQAFGSNDGIRTVCPLPSPLKEGESSDEKNAVNDDIHDAAEVYSSSSTDISHYMNRKGGRISGNESDNEADSFEEELDREDIFESDADISQYEGRAVVLEGEPSAAKEYPMSIPPDNIYTSTDGDEKEEKRKKRKKRKKEK